MINFGACVCIDWSKVSFKLVYELCHPSVAIETIQDGRQTKKKTLKANVIKSIVLTADLFVAICCKTNWKSFCAGAFDCMY